MEELNKACADLNGDMESASEGEQLARMRQLLKKHQEVQTLQKQLAVLTKLKQA